MLELEKLSEITLKIRRNIVKMVAEAKSGHPGGSLSAVELLTVLYFTQLNINQDNVNDVERDKFVLSKGHASPVLYSTLAAKGFIQDEELLTFRKINTRIQGHPSMNTLKCVDMSTGSLGQGISCAVGMAISNKIHNNEYRVYALLGDGEVQEGQVWEAFMSAAHYKLDNLLAIIDCNGLQIDGNVSDVMNIEPIDIKLEAFGWNVIKIDGHNMQEIYNACEEAKTVKGKPTVLIAKTIKGKGVSFMENNYKWHGVAPTVEQRDLALKELGE